MIDFRTSQNDLFADLLVGNIIRFKVYSTTTKKLHPDRILTVGDQCGREAEIEIIEISCDCEEFIEIKARVLKFFEFN